MAKPRKIPSHGKTTFADRQSAALLKTIFAAHRRVAESITTDDEWPNTDGTIDVQDIVQETDDDRAEIVATFTVQVKTLPETGMLKFPCGVGFLEYCKKMQDVLLLVADNVTGKVYWLYIDPAYVAEVDNGKNDTTVTLALDPKQSFSTQDASYIEAWIKLHTEKRTQISALEERIRESLDNEINVAKQLIEKHRYTEAFEYIEDLIGKRWDQAGANARFRMLANKASALMHLDQLDESVENFLQAYQLQPKLPKAQNNKAYALLMSGDHEQALKQANAVLKVNPIDVEASSVKAQALAHQGKSIKDIEKTLDTAVLNSSEVAHALGFAAKLLELSAESMEYLEKANKLDTSNVFIMADLGIALLEDVINNDRTAIRGNVNPTQAEKVNRGLELLQKAWAAVPDPRDKKFRADWLFDIAMAYRVLGSECDAEKANEELLYLVPDNEIYIKNAGVIAFEAKKFDVAEKYFRQLLEVGTTLPEISVMLVDALRAQSKNEEAVQVIEQYRSVYEAYEDLRADMDESRFDLLLLKNDLAVAQELADQLLSDPVTEMIGALFSARMARIKQDTETSLRMLERAEKAITDQTYKKLVIDLAEEAYQSSAFDVAARMYARVIINPTLDNQYAQRYLKSLYETGRYQEIIGVAQGIREARGSSRFITQFEWGAYLELQDLPNAQKIMEAYLQDHPDDEDVRLDLAVVFLRRNNTKVLDQYLASEIDLEKLDVLSQIQLANLYQTRGNPQRTLEVIYDVRRRHIDDPDAHSAYVNIFLGLDTSVSKIVDVESVQGGTALLYDGGHFMLEDAYEPRISENEISVADAERRGFIGKKKGDKIVLSENHLVKNEAEILEVQSKYVYALQDSMKNFERRFSDRHDLMGFSVKDGEDFAPLFKQLDERQEETQNIEPLYKEGKLTIDLFAKFVNRSLIEVFYALRSTPDLGIRVANGTVEEAKMVQPTLEDINKSDLVADVTALITLFELGMKPADMALNKFVVAQRTHDVITTLINELETFGKKTVMTLYKRGGQYIRQEITAKEQRQRLASMKRFAKWVKANTITKALTQDQIDAIEEKAERPERLDDLIQAAQLDTIKLSIGSGKILYSDDLGLRGLSVSSFGVKGVWTQALVRHALDQGKISEEKYNQVVVQLIMANYHHVSITPQVLLCAAKEAQWQPNEPLLSALKSISRPETTPVSMVVVLVNFLYELYKQPTVADKSHIVHQVLNETTRHHDKRGTIILLRKGLATRFKLLPTVLKEIDDTIVAWLTLHNL